MNKQKFAASGELHYRAKLTTQQVDQIRRLHENERWGYRRLSDHFDVPRATIQALCNYSRRANR